MKREKHSKAILAKVYKAELSGLPPCPLKVTKRVDRLAADGLIQQVNALLPDGRSAAGWMLTDYGKRTYQLLTTPQQGQAE